MQPEALNELSLSVVIPVLNEASQIGEQLSYLQPLRDSGAEIIVVDGGSSDETVALVTPMVDQVVVSPRGRAAQMNAGAAHATGEFLLFLHADTRLPESAADLALRWRCNRISWGFFSLQLSSPRWQFRWVEWLINLRSRLTGIGTGDQALFVARELFMSIGGFPDIPLMEDIAICKKLKQLGRPLWQLGPVITSSRRWEEQGMGATILLMWRLRLAYFFGASPRSLVQKYYPS